MALPLKQDIEIYRGDDVDIEFQLLDCDSKTAPKIDGILSGPTVINGTTITPVDITGGTLLAQIKETTRTSEAIAATFTITVVDASIGYFVASLTHTQTTTLGANEDSSKVYDIQLTDTGGKVKTWVRGDIQIVMDTSS